MSGGICCEGPGAVREMEFQNKREKVVLGYMEMNANYSPKIMTPRERLGLLSSSCESLFSCPKN